MARAHQAFLRRVQRFQFFRKREPHLGFSQAGRVIKTRARHHRDADLGGQIFRKREIIRLRIPFRKSAKT